MTSACSLSHLVSLSLLLCPPPPGAAEVRLPAPPTRTLYSQDAARGGDSTALLTLTCSSDPDPETAEDMSLGEPATESSIHYKYLALTAVGYYLFCITVSRYSPI